MEGGGKDVGGWKEWGTLWLGGEQNQATSDGGGVCEQNQCISSSLKHYITINEIIFSKIVGAMHMKQHAASFLN